MTIMVEPSGNGLFYATTDVDEMGGGYFGVYTLKEIRRVVTTTEVVSPKPPKKAKRG